MVAMTGECRRTSKPVRLTTTEFTANREASGLRADKLFRQRECRKYRSHSQCAPTMVQRHIGYRNRCLLTLSCPATKEDDDGDESCAKVVAQLQPKQLLQTQPTSHN